MSEKPQKLRQRSMEFVKLTMVKVRETRILRKGLRMCKTLSTWGLIRQMPRLHRKANPQVARQATKLEESWNMGVLSIFVFRDDTLP